MQQRSEGVAAPAAAVHQHFKMQFRWIVVVMIPRPSNNFDVLLPPRFNLFFPVVGVVGG